MNCRPLIKENVDKEIKKNVKQGSSDGKQIQKLKGRITRSNSLPSLFCPAINQLRGKKFDEYFIVHVNNIISFCR